ncbi:MAG: VOC family protein [Balneolaceae bacterium]
MEKLFQKVDTVFVTVENRDKTKAWYQEMLDLKLIWENEYVSVLSTGTGTPITLMPKNDSGDKQPLFNFLTPDIEKAHKHLKENGVEVKPIIEEENLKTFDFIDPEGNKLNVCYLENQ